MTKQMYLNIILSIRDFLYNINPQWRWYLDTVNERMNEDVFIEVLTSMQMMENYPYKQDFMNINVYAKDNIDDVVGTIVEALESRVIPVKDFAGGTGEIIDHLEITRIDIKTLGVTESGHVVRNLSVYYKILE